MRPSTSPISDYALIGDSRSAALISKRGSIDWLCWPRFDSPSIFGALVDAEKGGHWSLAPVESFQAHRRYLTDTNVLVTRFRTETGVLTLTDFMPVAEEGDKHHHLFAEHEVVRIARCESGEVTLECHYAPRPNYAQKTTQLREHGNWGVRLDTHEGMFALRSDCVLRIADPCVVRSHSRLKAGDSRVFSLTFARDDPAVYPPLLVCGGENLARTIAYWRNWSAHTRYEGPFPEPVRRSALALKLLTYAPSGAVVAAPTTSLPERLGGALNWDYCYCWLRDAALTTRALFGLGHAAEAHAFVSWLLHTTQLSRPKLRIFYDVFGNLPVDERSLPHLSGYDGSSPVRIGNAAEEQLQLDVYGEVIEATTLLVRHGLALDRDTQSMLRSFGEYICRSWELPDEGIWEGRQGRFQHTHSKLLCWVALDRLIALAEGGELRRIPLDYFQKNRELIRSAIHERAWNRGLGAYTQTLDGDALDASVLLIPWYGFEPSSSPRMRSTAKRLRQELGTPNGLLYRNVPPGPEWTEGAFGVCAFWFVEQQAQGGASLHEALAGFETVLSCANDVGLFAEEMDPRTGAALGNFPQAFTHIGLINAALSLEKRSREEVHA